MKDKIIVLAKNKSRESDLVIRGLNTNGAKVGFYARAALKSRKRFGGGILEPFHYLEVSFDRTGRRSGYQSELYFLKEATLIYDFPALRIHWDRLQQGFHFLQLIDKVSQYEALDSSGLFDLLGNTLKSLETTTQLEKLRLHFELKLLAQSGVLPMTNLVKPYLAKPISEHFTVDLPCQHESSLRSQVRSSLEQLLN